MNVDIIKYSDIGGRRENEDAVAYQMYGQNLVAVLADGLGGQGDGSIASRLACESLIRCGEDERFPDKDSLEAAFERANQEILQRQLNSFHMKTTAVYLCINRDRAIWAHIGDSRLYHLFNGRLCECTLDHSASQLAVFMGQIRREDIPNDPNRNRLLRALGVRDEKPDVHDAIELQKGTHTFLLCSDGLWEYLTDAEIESASEKAENVQTLLGLLTFLKNSRSSRGCDNNSAIVIRMEV